MKSIANGLGVRTCLDINLYLGIPSMIGCSKKALFKFIKDRMWKKINSGVVGPYLRREMKL